MRRSSTEVVLRLDCSAAAWLTAHRASAVGDHTTGSCPNYLKGSAPDWGLREGGTDTAEAGRSKAYTGLEQPHTLPGHLPGQGRNPTVSMKLVKRRTARARAACHINSHAGKHHAPTP